MKRVIFIITVCLFSFSCHNGNDGNSEIIPDSIVAKSNYIEGEVIIKFKEGSSANVIKGDSQVISVNRAYKHILKESPQTRSGKSGMIRSRAEKMGLRRIHKVKLTEGVSVKEMIKKYYNHRDVEYIQPNYIYEMDATPDDPEFVNQYSHQMMQSELAWDISTGSSDIIVAVIGSGVDIDHPDLEANIFVNSGEIPDNGVDDDLNGYIDDVNGWNFSYDNNDPRPDGSSHETMVAGIIAAVGNNGLGISGISWSSKIMPLRVSYNSVTTSGQVAEAIEYAMNNGARIINMSFGYYERLKYGDGVVKDSVDNAFSYNGGSFDGMLMIATAGNNVLDSKRFPAALYNVIAVGATDQNDGMAVWSNTSGSNYGPWVDVAAPGTSVLSTVLGEGYSASNGTSFSAPNVAGVAALLLSVKPDLSNMEARAVLENTTDPINYSDNHYDYIYIGTGRVNAYSALLNADTDYPLGEIASPYNKEIISESDTNLNLDFFVDGDYTLEYSTLGTDEWSTLASGSVQSGMISYTMSNPGIGTYTIKLTVSKNDYHHTDTKIFSVYGQEQVGWNKDIPGNYRRMNSNPIIMDIDNDGRNEIIQSSYGDNGSSIVGYTYIWKDDGTILPGWPKEISGDPSCSTSAVGDVDGDGDYEIISTTYAGANVYVWHWQNGELLDGWPQKITDDGNIRANPVLADLDGDGDSEIIVAVKGFFGNETSGIYALQDDGTSVWNSHYFIANVQAPPAVADLDNDGNVEVIISAGVSSADSKGQVVVLSNSGDEIISVSGGCHKGPVISDVNNDGVLDIISIAENNTNSSKIRALNLNGDIIWENIINEDIAYYGSISAGDLDGDGNVEIFTVTSHYISSEKIIQKIYALDSQGNILPGFPKYMFGNSMQGGPIIGDIDGDAQKEIIAVSSSNDYSSQNRATTMILAWNKDGSTVSTFPRIVADEADFSMTKSFTVNTAPSLADFDLDGDVDILLPGTDGRFFIWDLPSAYNPDDMEWPIYRHDPQCSGIAIKAPKFADLNIPAEIYTGETFELELTSDYEGDSVIKYYVKQMPVGAVFNDQTNTITWTPSSDQIGENTFSLFLTDSIRQDRKIISVNVAEPSYDVEITSLYSMDSYIRIRWSSENSNINKVMIQWSKDSTFSTITGETASFNKPAGFVNIMENYLDGPGTYYFRVMACEGEECGSWSSTESVVFTPNYDVEITGLNDYGTHIVISWFYDNTNVDKVIIQWSKDSTFSTITGQGIMTYPSIGWRNVMYYDLDGSDTYYFRIMACDGDYCGSWSSTESVVFVENFDVEISGLYDNSNYLQVHWSYFNNNIDKTILQWSKDSSFSTISGESVNSEPSTGWRNVMYYDLDGPGTYYFRIMGCDGEECGPWSSVESVNVSADCEITELQSVWWGLYISVDWDCNMDNIDHYRLQWSTDSDFSSVMGEDTDISGSSNSELISYRDLDGHGKTYYFRISSCNESECGQWSDVQSLYY